MNEIWIMACLPSVILTSFCIALGGKRMDISLARARTYIDLCSVPFRVWRADMAQRAGKAPRSDWQCDRQSECHLGHSNGSVWLSEVSMRCRGFRPWNRPGKVNVTRRGTQDPENEPMRRCRRPYMNGLTCGCPRVYDHPWISSQGPGIPAARLSGYA